MRNLAKPNIVTCYFVKNNYVYKIIINPINLIPVIYKIGLEGLMFVQ